MNTTILLNNITEKAEKCLSEIYSLKKEKSEIQNEYNLLAEELHKANNLLQRNDIEINSLKNANTTQESVINSLKNEITNYKNEISKLSESIKSKENEMVLSRKKNDELIKINSDLETKNDDLLNEFETEKKLIKEYETELQRLKDFFEQKKKIVTKKKTKEKI